MSEAELRGYLMHCFRNAGGEFEKAFEADCVAVIHAASGGTPRIANNIVEAVMTAATAKDVVPVTSSLVAEVAQEQFDYESPAEHFAVRSLSWNLSWSLSRTRLLSPRTLLSTS